MNFQTCNRYTIKQNPKILSSFSPGIKLKSQQHLPNEQQSNTKRFQRNNNVKKNCYKNCHTPNTERQNNLQIGQQQINKYQIPQKQKWESTKTSLLSIDDSKNNTSVHLSNNKFLSNHQREHQDKSPSSTSLLAPRQQLELDTSILSQNTVRIPSQRTDSTIKNPQSIKQQIVEHPQYNTANFKYYEGPIYNKSKYFTNFYSYFNPNNNQDHSQLANFSTEESILQISAIQKKTTSTQTQTKKSISTLTNTDPPKTSSIKIQTDQTIKSYDRTIEQLKTKIIELQKQNKEIKQQMLQLEKQNYGKIRNYQSYPQKKNNYGTDMYTRNINDGSVKQSFKEMSLQMLIDNLKKQIESLKTGMGIKRLQQIIQAIKKQNLLLSNQLQSISLKFRVLQQQNTCVVNTQQQNRKLKMQIKYFRSTIKQVKQEIDRLKNQNCKLRKKSSTGGNDNCFGKEKLRQTFSETDSLNLSISMVRD